MGDGSSGLLTTRVELPHRSSMYKRLPQAVTNLLPSSRHSTSGGNTDASFRLTPGNEARVASHQREDLRTPYSTPSAQQIRQSGGSGRESTSGPDGGLPVHMQLPPGMTAEEVSRAFQVVAATASAFHSQQAQQKDGHVMSTPQPTLRRQPSHFHEREISRGNQGGDLESSDPHGGHDAPNWSRTKSFSVLLSCTILYAFIAGKSLVVLYIILE